MKVIRFYDVNDLRLEEVSKPEPSQGQLLLKTASVGICGSDLHYYEEGGTGGIQLDRALILGHEFSAWIESGPNKGQLAAVEPALPCSECEFCLEGNPNFCINLNFAGAENTDGALQEYLVWPEKSVFPLPEDATPEEGALLEPLGVAIHSIRLGNLFPGMDVGVFGAGPIGLLIIQLAKNAGASRIFATDKLNHRLECALECGATDILKADGNEAEKILSATSDRGLDVTFETAGDDGSAVEMAVLTAKRGATAVLVGIPVKDETQFSASAARRRGLTLKICRRMKNTYPTAIRLLSENQINLKPLITDQYSLEEYNQAFENAAKRHGIKTFINFNRE